MIYHMIEGDEPPKGLHFGFIKDFPQKTPVEIYILLRIPFGRKAVMSCLWADCDTLQQKNFICFLAIRIGHLRKKWGNGIRARYGAPWCPV